MSGQGGGAGGDGHRAARHQAGGAHSDAHQGSQQVSQGKHALGPVGVKDRNGRVLQESFLMVKIKYKKKLRYPRYNYFEG